MQPLIKTIVEKATKKGGYYSIDYREGDEYQKITNDITLLCNQKSTDEYVGLSNLDESIIRIYDSNKESRGWIFWIAYNNGIDRLSDYSTGLEDFINITEVYEKWEDDFYLL
tara:strand:- start:57 stop:392 length:336 start_codon:yes stop_codon:yes gene_type:complete